MSQKKTWTKLRKRNFMSETDSCAKERYNDQFYQVNIDKTPQNSICRLRGDRDKANNQVISECSKSAPKEYKTRNDLVWKVIHWELWKKLKCDYTNEWYMRNQESVTEKETRKILWDIDIQTHHLISVRLPDLVIIKKRKENLPNNRLCRSYWPVCKTERKWKRDTYQDFAIELKRLWNMTVTMIRIVIGALGTVIKILVKGTRGIGNKKTSEDHLNYSIGMIDQNTLKLSEIRMEHSYVKFQVFGRCFYFHKALILVDYFQAVKMFLNFSFLWNFFPDISLYSIFYS